MGAPKADAHCILSAALRSVIESEVQKHETTAIGEVAQENGYSTPAEFEGWCAVQLSTAGWQARVTGQAGDQGVDVRAECDGITLVLQCKLYNQPVGNSAVQEAFAGKSYYRAQLAAVVCTAGFTKSARALAAQTGVKLLLPQELSAFIPPPPVALRAA